MIFDILNTAALEFFKNINYFCDRLCGELFQSLMILEIHFFIYISLIIFLTNIQNKDGINSYVRILSSILDPNLVEF